MKRFFTTKCTCFLILGLLCLVLLAGVTVCGSQEDTASQEANTDTASQSQTGTSPAESAQPLQQTDREALPKDQTADSNTNKDVPAPKTAQSETANDNSEGSTKENTPQRVNKDKLTCTLSVECKTILGNMDEFDPDKISVLPQDGVILAPTEVTFQEGDTAFDVLEREMRDQKIQMEFVSTPVYESNYIEGIHNIYEFDCGPLSGWMYKVNGSFPTYGSSLYELKDGDAVEWLYSCDLGEDVGGNNITGDNTK